MFRFIGKEDMEEFEQTLKLNWQAYAVKELYKQNLKTIIDQVLTKVSPPASIDILISTITININLFAYLYAGTDKNQSKSAVEFIRKYMGQVDKRYTELGGLLYNLLRHGYAHRACSKRVKLDVGAILDFEYGFGEKHLVINRTLDSLLLRISLPTFCNDLLRAIDLYAEDVNKGSSLCHKFEVAFQGLREAEEETSLRHKGLTQDFDHIRTLLM
jgi:hypothetical protein